MVPAEPVQVGTGVDGTPHRQSCAFHQVGHVVAATREVIAVLVLVLVAAPRPLDETLGRGDHRVGSPQVVAKNVDRPVEVGTSPRRLAAPGDHLVPRRASLAIAARTAVTASVTGPSWSTA